MTANIGDTPLYDKKGLGLYREQQLQSIAESTIEKYSNLGSDIKKPKAPRSLFYEAAKRNSGNSSNFGNFLFYSFGNGDNIIGDDAYHKSERSNYNIGISSVESKNPSAGYLVRCTGNLEGTLDNGTINANYQNEIIGGLAAPYYWKDFLYCRLYGSIPNNYMITLRRFPSPVLDNLSIPPALKGEKFANEGVNRPVAQAVTWFGDGTGNSLKELISFSTGITWSPISQNEILEQKAFSKGFFVDGPIKTSRNLISKANSDFVDNFIENSTGGINLIVAGLDTDETLIRQGRSRNIRGLGKERTGLLGNYIWTSVDTIQNAFVRGLGLPFTWGNGGIIQVTFEYELSSIGEVNTKAAMLDILANLLSIGTNYGNFMTPDTRWDANMPAVGFPGGDRGLEQFFKDPTKWAEKYLPEIMDPSNTNKENIPETIGNNNNFENLNDSQMEAIKQSLSKFNTEKLTHESWNNIKEAFGDGAERVIKYLFNSDFIANFQAPASFLTGAPIGEWHLVIGNPCNPIAMIGNLICDGVHIEFGELLGPDDFPTTIKAKFSLKHGRDRERGEIESIFNRGDGRLYSEMQKTYSNEQSYGAYADVAGNIFNSDIPNEFLQGNTWEIKNRLPDE